MSKSELQLGELMEPQTEKGNICCLSDIFLLITKKKNNNHLNFEMRALEPIFNLILLRNEVDRKALLI